MCLRADLAYASELTPEKLENFRRHIPDEWILEALYSTGHASMRRRRLPADQAVWLVIGMALMRDLPITDVVDKLELALPAANGVVARSVVAEARARLGDEPLEWLFLRCAGAWAHASADKYRWNGLALYGVDGSTLRVADSDENRGQFGGQSAGKHGRGESGYPMVRFVTLMALRSHLIAAASFGPYGNSEYTYAADVWNAIPENSLTLVDRGFFAAHVLIPLARDGANRHWMTRAKKNNRWRVIARLGPGDALVEMKVSSVARKRDPSLPKTWRMRAINYKRKGCKPSTLLTSLTDAKAYPAGDLVRLYHERWEIELGYGEIKTEMFEGELTLRSKSPSAVRQELWGLLLAYNLVRMEIEKIADEAGVEPVRISFVTALRFMRDEWLLNYGTRSPGAIPSRLRRMRERIKRFILPNRRERSYPRAVKIKMSAYPLNRGSRRKKR